MSTLRRRLETMKALVQGSAEIQASPITRNAIAWEFDEALSANRLDMGPRRLLLQVLHSTRALDTFLATFLAFYAVTSGKSLRGYLNALEAYTGARFDPLPPGRANYYQGKIVNLRNTYMHQAGTSPRDHIEIVRLLTEMQRCLAEVTSL